MSQDWGYTVQPQQGGGDIMHALAEADRPRHSDKSAGQWIKSNLFNTWYNSIITLVFGALAFWAGYYAIRFVLFTARWEPVSDNIELFMIGLFPRDEITRIVSQFLLLAGALGLFIGWLRTRALNQAHESGAEIKQSPLREYLSVYSAVTLFITFTLVIGADTIGPWLLTLGCIVAAVTSYMATLRLTNPLFKLVLLSPLAITAGVLSTIPDLNNQAAYAIAAAATIALVIVHFVRALPVTLTVGMLAAVLAFQSLSGTDGLAWLYLTLASLPTVFWLLAKIDDRRMPALGWAGAVILTAALVWNTTINSFDLWSIVLLAALASAVAGLFRSDPSTGARFGATIVAAALATIISDRIGFPGIDWGEWGGLQLNIVVASAAIILAFPVGLMLALARRSSLPVLRYVATVYIELIRGVPLISLLLMGQFFIGFFVNSDTPLSNVTRATTAITMFSAAYIAEIVRGGLQAVDKGQTEAGQALGLTAAKITRLLVLPQALRAVIPAMVGQFISLFKDTSLLSIIAILEFLGVREIIHAQEAFRGFGIAETLVYVAFGFWAFSFTMSRESQRLERRLEVGDR
jgi:general L-amino acid transport system permease protein